jgi:hypothetical protein
MSREELVTFTQNLKEKMADSESIIDCGNAWGRRMDAFLVKIREGAETVA